MKLSEETLTPELVGELTAMFSAHNNETYSTIGILNPDFNLYFTLASSGGLIVVVARENEEPAGYIFMIVSPHPHHRDKIVSTQDIFFVSEKYRRGMVGVKLLKEAERISKERGADFVSMSASESRRLDKYYERYGYILKERVYYKQVGD